MVEEVVLLVVEEVGGEERFWHLLMTCICLASDWLTALSVTVIKPIQPTERLRERTR